MIQKLLRSFVILLIGVLTFSLSFSVYFLTTSEFVQSGDSTEMVTAAITLGIPHQPGYPLNTLIGHVFYKLDYFGLKAVQRLNLASSFIQALTVFAFYFLMHEVFPDKKSKTISKLTAAFSASMVLAFSLIFWQYATKFEVFPLNNLFTVLILLLAFKITQTEKNSQPRGISFGKFILLSILLGLAITHHQTIVLIFPVVVIILWPLFFGFIASIKKADAFEKRKLIKKAGVISATAVLSILIGMSLYFYLILNFSKGHPLMSGGDIKTFGEAFSTLVRSEYGVFSPYLKMENSVRVNYPFDQITYYLNSVWNDFSIYGVVFMVVGLIYLFKNNRRLIVIILTGITISGFLFLAYANFPLSDTFNQATVRRFYMLPDIFLAILAGMGIYSLTSFLSSLAVKNKSSSINFAASKIIIIGISMINIYFNFGKANIKDDNLTELYIEKSYASIPDGSLVMVSGDIQNMTGEFYRMFLKPDTKTMIFTPGRFYLKWYLRDLFERYDNLSLPAPEGGNMFTTTTQIIDANYGKSPIFVSYDLLEKDPGIKKNYTLYPRNLFYEVKKKGEDVKLEEWREENKKLYESLDFQRILKIRARGANFEEMIVGYFARYFYESGYVYSKVGLWEDAMMEYQRSANLEPLLADNYLGLSESYANKENPDYVSAINYLSQYQNMIYSVDPNKAYEVQKTLEEYQNKYNEAYKKEIEQQKLDASRSGELKEASGSGDTESVNK